MTFETEYSIYHNGEWYDKSKKVLVLPDGTRIENLAPSYDNLVENAYAGSIGMEFPNTDTYFVNPAITVDVIRHASKHYLFSRILKQIDDFAFNGAKIVARPPEDEAANITEEEIQEVQAKVDQIDKKVIKTVLRMRQAVTDQIIYGSAIFERILGNIEGWKAPVIFKRLPAYSFCERPIGRMDITRYVVGDILYGIVFDKQTDTYEYWQKQNNISNPIQIPTKNVIHVKDEISEQVDGDSFVAKILPLIKKLEYADMALMETVHRAGAPLLWLQIEEYRDNPQAQGQGIWSPKKAYEEGKKIAINHGKNNAMIAPSCIKPIPLDYRLAIDPIRVIESYEARILKAMIPRDFTEQTGAAVSKSATPTLRLLMLVAEGWREKVSGPFEELWRKIFEDNGYPGWSIEIQWTDLDPVDETELYRRAQIAFTMGDTFSQNEIREIADWPAKSEVDEEQIEIIPEVKSEPKPTPEPKPSPKNDTVKTESGEVVKDRQEEPIENSVKDIEAKLKEKVKLFEQVIKNMGYWPE